MLSSLVSSDVHKKYFSINGQRIAYKKGHYLVSPMDKNLWVYYLAEGHVRICFSFDNGRQSILGFFTPGMTFAQTGSFFDQEDGGLEYVADSDIIIYRLPRKQFLTHLKTNAAFNAAYVQSILRNQMYLIDRITYQGEHRIYERTMRWLIMMAKFYGNENETGSCTLTIPMTQDTIANFLHVTRESVNSALTKLRKAGLITIKHRLITINSLDKLKKALDKTT